MRDEDAMPHVEREEAANAAPDEDTEGQSIASMLAMRELSKDRRAHKQPADDALPELTKKFPRMRSDEKK
ncbi:MAG TPA: hypothetical protein VFR93_04585 [Candidatus Limnocylindrales bacterium]|nr:hypothetical protein [Candidatus Limnocylindrales bacterium]